MVSELDDDVLDFAHRMFDLARDGDADALAAHLEAGADPELGSPSAVELARFFDLPEMLAQLCERSD